MAVSEMAELRKHQGWPVRPLCGVLQTFIRPVAAQGEWLEMAESRQRSPQFARRRPDTQVDRDQSHLLKFDSHLEGPLVAVMKIFP